MPSSGKGALYPFRGAFWIHWIGRFILIIAFQSCSAPQVLWVVDSLWVPVLGEEFPRQIATVERESGYRIKTVPYSYQESDRVDIEKHLGEGTYAYVVVSPYVSMELEALEVRFSGVTFLCMDAPEGFTPHANVRGISFDPVPSLKEALKKWEQYRSSKIPKDKERKLLILAKDSLPIFQESGFMESTLNERLLVIPNGEAEDVTRKNLRRELAQPVDLLVVWAGKATALTLEILSGLENRKSMGLIGWEIHRFPGIEDHPFVVSLYKDYAGALSQILKGASIPSRIPYNMFSP